MFATLLERLAEMFPGSDYQSKLEQYIAQRNPQNTADVEMLERQYYQDRQRGLVWNFWNGYLGPLLPTENVRFALISTANASTTK